MELDGRPVTAEQLAQLGLAPYGHFTSMRVDDRHVKGLTLHMERLQRDCGHLFGADLDTDKVRALVRRSVGDTLGTFVVRVTIYDPTLSLGHPDSRDPHVLVTSREVSPDVLPPLKVCTVPYERETPWIKHIGLYGSLAVRRQAQRSGFDDAIFVARDGRLSEGVTWNLGYVIGGEPHWTDAEVLPGVTARLVDDAHGSLPVRVLHEEALGQIEAVFATNTSVGVRPISVINENAYTPEHPVLRKLRDEYAMVEAEAI